MAAVPVVDGLLIKKAQSPYMVGSISHDIAPAVLHPMTKKWAEKNEAYLWHFSRKLPGDDKGAWHSRNRRSVMCFGDDKPMQGKVKMGKLIATTLTNKPVGE